MLSRRTIRRPATGAFQTAVQTLGRLDNPEDIRDALFAVKSGTPRHAAELRAVHGVYDARWLTSGDLEVRYSAKMFDQEHLTAYLKNKGLL